MSTTMYDKLSPIFSAYADKINQNASDITDVNTSLVPLYRYASLPITSWEQGTISSSNGAELSSSSRIRTTVYITADEAIAVKASDGYELGIFAYDSEGTYVGAYKDTGSFVTSSSFSWVTSFSIASYPSYKYIIVLRNATSTSSSVSTTEYTNALFNMPNVDSSLTISGSFADAYATGEAIDNAVDSITENFNETEYEGIFTITPVWTSGYVGPSGTVYESDSVAYMQAISVKEGDVIQGFDSTLVQTPSIRYLCAYSNGVAVPSAGLSTAEYTYTVPAGIDSVVISIRTQHNCDTIKLTRTCTRWTTPTDAPKLGFMRATGDLDDGESLTLPVHNVKNYCLIAFSCRVSELSSVKIGKSVGGTPYVTIDSTNLVIVNDLTSFTVAHGLTIGSTLSVRIENENSIYVKRITIESDGETYVYENSSCRWIADTGAVYVTSDGSTLTDCVLSWTSRKINAPVWVFGDSYISFYSERWVSYLISDGLADGVMFNGYAGENSKNAMIALESLLAIRTPNTVVWCLGMNDADSDDAVNSNWNKAYLRLVEYAKEYGFNLVLATIPAIPSNLNTYKNAIVRASGYQYIDFASAVNVGTDGTWVDGALNDDAVHPSVTGAKILYSRAIADCPQLVTMF